MQYSKELNLLVLGCFEKVLTVSDILRLEWSRKLLHVVQCDMKLKSPRCFPPQKSCNMCELQSVGEPVFLLFQQILEQNQEFSKVSPIFSSNRHGVKSRKKWKEAFVSRIRGRSPVFTQIGRNTPWLLVFTLLTWLDLYSVSRFRNFDSKIRRKDSKWSSIKKVWWAVI